MADMDDLLSGLDLLDFWRALLCLFMATLIYLAVSHGYPGEPPATLAAVIFGPALVFGLW
ncbi:MAG: hypothetical protein K0R03_2669 [Moraxellaceae bacterium]|jgi:hypothetical protein|nr:hypothetical protein [Moraxellaceae bacterium]